MTSVRRRPVITAILVLAATAAPMTVASRGSAAGSDLQLGRTETMQSIGDSAGDSRYSQGDIVGASALMSADGMTAVSVTVQQYDSPFSVDWQLSLTTISWKFDVDQDRAPDFDLTMLGIDDTVVAGLFEGTTLVCEAVPTWNPAARAYGASFPTSCLGGPARFDWYAEMEYEDYETETGSTDRAPNAAWSGPVVNETRPCVPESRDAPGPASDGYVALTPARLLDTRPGMPTIDCQFTGSGPVGGTNEVELVVGGRGGVPANATAVVLNVTATLGAEAGFVTVYPCGTTRPVASSLNYAAGSTVANAVIARVGAGGTVCMFSNASVHLVADVNGYFVAGSGFVPAGPSRVYDSRASSSIRPAGSATTFGPFSASSVVLNVVITGSRADGFATVYPCGSARPLASNLNFRAGTTVANAVVAKVGNGGMVCVFTSATAHLVVDLNGSYKLNAGYTAVVPARLLETRSGLGTVDGRDNGIGLVAGPKVVELLVRGRGGVPTDASAVVLNVTVDDTRGEGFITVFPCGSPQPNASNLNYVTRATIPNAVVTKVGAGGKICLYSNAATHLIVDVNGFYPAA